MRKKSGLVRGVGKNDSDYEIGKNSMVDGKQIAIWRCPIYRCWDSMLERCYSPSFHERWPTYIGCSMVDEWHEFSNFRSWMITQNWLGMVIDKDILSLGNKIYGPETCVFVPGALNLFLTDRGRGRGECPIGVFFDRSRRKFRGMCRNPFTRKQESLGSFDSPVAAHEAWLSRKHQHACRYADMQTDSRIALALRARYLPNTEHK